MPSRSVGKSRPVRRGGAGLILVVLIALAIMLLLYFGNMGTGGSYMQGVQKTRDQGRAMQTQINTQQLLTMIAQYKLQNDKLPASVEDLEAPAAAFRDPWGQQITFEFEQSGASTTVIFRSPGPDGEKGTEDDVTTREPMPV